MPLASPFYFTPPSRLWYFLTFCTTNDLLPIQGHQIAPASTLFSQLPASSPDSSFLKYMAFPSSAVSFVILLVLASFYLSYASPIVLVALANEKAT